MSAVGWTCFVECSSCRFFQEIPEWQEKLSCPHNEGYNCPGTMLWRASGFRWLMRSQWKERAENTTCVCQRPVATLRVCKMSGDVVEIGVGEKWTVLEAKTKLAKAINIPVREQCWSFKQRLLHDSSLIETLQSADVVLEIFLALRDPEVALWMERITSDWTVVERKFEQIPKKVWKSSEVILEILRNSKTALSYADAELLDDAGFLLQACQMRGYKKNVTPPYSLQWYSLQWLETVADCQVCLCYAMKQDDKDLAIWVITHFEQMIAKANQMDIVTFVVFAFSCNALTSWREHLLTLLKMLKGLSQPALSHGFCSRAVADLDLARALLHEHENPGPAPAAFGDWLLPPLPDSLLRHEDFALGVLLTHEDRLTPKEFELCFSYQTRRARLPTSEARALLTACLSRSYEFKRLTQFLTWASQADYKSFVPFILEKDISVLFLENIASEHRAAIFQELLDFWGGPERIVAFIRKDHKKIQSLLRWAICQKDAAICTSKKVRETLAHFVESKLYEAGGAQVGKTLFSLCFAGANLPTNIVETIPVEWFKELTDVRGSEPFLSSTLLLRMEQCEDTTFKDKFPEVWCPVWGSLQEKDCCRAVGLVARWCKLAGLDRDGTAFAIKVLRCLPLHVLSGSSLDIIYSPELPAQAGTIYVMQLLERNRKEDREELRRLREFVYQVDQKLTKVSHAAAEAMRVAKEAEMAAADAEMAARRAQSEARDAEMAARRAQSEARDASRTARKRCQWYYGTIVLLMTKLRCGDLEHDHENWSQVPNAMGNIFELRVSQCPWSCSIAQSGSFRERSCKEKKQGRQTFKARKSQAI